MTPEDRADVTPLSDDEPDEWDKRIIKTGCAAENEALVLCHADKKDWRLCLKEMEAFKRCWKQQHNDERVATTNAQ